MVDVAVRAFGAGPTIWVLHSLLADAGSCMPFAEALSRDFRVLVPDLPGFGGSAAVGPALDEVAGRIAAAMDEDEGPAVLFGNGYGSFVALTLALDHPALVRKLVLAGTGAAFSEPGRAAFRAMADAAQARGLGAIADVAMRRLFAAEFQEAQPALADARRAAFLATDPDVFRGACLALAELDLRAAVRAMAIDTLVMVGEKDEATPAAMARELASLLPRARLEILDGLAHVPQLQAPGRVAEVVRDFVG